MAGIKGTCKWLSLLPDLRESKCFERTILLVPRKKERVSSLGRAKQQRHTEVSPESSCSFDLLDKQTGLNRKRRQKRHIILVNKYGPALFRSLILEAIHNIHISVENVTQKIKGELKWSKGHEHQLKNSTFFSLTL